MRGFQTRRVNFQVVQTKVTRTIACPDCGKKMKRTRNFEQTINPFNTNDDGTVKDRAQIQKENAVKAKAWVAEAGTSVELCKACYDK